MSGEDLVPHSRVSNVTWCKLQIWVSLDRPGSEVVAIIALEGDSFGNINSDSQSMIVQKSQRSLSGEADPANKQEP